MFILIALLYIYINKLYNASKEKHRIERLELIFFIGHYMWKTGISIRRCYSPLFAIFEKKYFGIIFEGIQVIVYDKQKNILICERDKTRQKLGLYDIGAGGMVPHKESVYNTAKEELHEELSLLTEIYFYKTITPYDGANCIIHLYYTVVNDEKIISLDGTYTKMIFLSKKEIIENYYDKMKHDGKLILKKFI